MDTPYINIEESRLLFTRRVLEEAFDKNNPLLERLRFLSIFSSNLDEFFMVQFCQLKHRLNTAPDKVDELTGLLPCALIDAVLCHIEHLMAYYETVRAALFEELKSADIEYLDIRTQKQRRLSAIRHLFFDAIMPLLTVVIVDAKHPFPFLPSGSAFAAVRIGYKNSEKLGLILFPEATPKPVFLESGSLRFFLAEDAASYFAGNVFADRQIIESGIFRITRNAGLVMDDDALPKGIDYRAALSMILEKRKRLEPVRLQSRLKSGSRLVRLLSRHLDLHPKQVFCQSGPLDFRYVHNLIDSARTHGLSHLLYRELKSVYAPGLSRGDSMIAQMKGRDRLMIHPYVDFDAILALLREAAYDQSVVAIRQTLYRLSGQSEVARYLAAAAQNGKEVTVVIELNARFDEQSNLSWAAILENAGCRVIYGHDGLKVHAKLLLITRSTAKGIRHIAHISTGNYNENTTRIYSDIGILTTDPIISNDIVRFFRDRGSGTTGGSYHNIRVSPDGIRDSLMCLLDQEIAYAQNNDDARVIFKCNALCDKAMIDKLIEASVAGVKVDLIIRGPCCLIAGLNGFSQNVRIVSIVGRFLEHARVYWFSSSGKLFISSADLMPRNLDHRIEVLCPVRDKHIADCIMHMLSLQLRDTAKGRFMLPTGRYSRIKTADGIADSQDALYHLFSEIDESSQPYRLRRAVKRLRLNLGKQLIRLGRRFSRQ